MIVSADDLPLGHFPETNSRGGDHASYSNFGLFALVFFFLQILSALAVTPMGKPRFIRSSNVQKIGLVTLQPIRIRSESYFTRRLQISNPSSYRRSLCVHDDGTRVRERNSRRIKEATYHTTTSNTRRRSAKLTLFKRVVSLICVCFFFLSLVKKILFQMVKNAPIFSRCILNSADFLHGGTLFEHIFEIPFPIHFLIHSIYSPLIYRTNCLLSSVHKDLFAIIYRCFPPTTVARRFFYFLTL